MHKKRHIGLLTYFPPPSFLTMPSVGMEVTAEAVRFLELVPTTKGPRVGRYGSYPLAIERDEELLENETVKRTVAKAREEHRLDLVSVALPEEKAYLYTVEIPQGPQSETDTAVELSLEEHVPIPPQEAVFGYLQASTERPHHVGANVTAIPSLLARRYFEFFTAAGLTPVSFQVGAQTATNAVVPCGDNTPLIVARFGVRNTSLCLVSDRTVHFTSLVNVGGADLTEAIRKNFSISEEEAERRKRERGITRGKGEEELFFSMVNTLSALKDEIGRLAAYWESHAERYLDRRTKVAKIVLCGPESPLPGLAEYLEAALHIPTSLADVWTNAFSLDRYLPPVSRDESLAFASVIGLSDLLC